MRMRTTVLAGAAALAVLGGAACAGSEESGPQSDAQTSASSAAAAPTATATSGGQPSASASAAASAPAKLNLNSATREQFLTVPGVGDRMVREFEEYRPYTSIAQFRREIGKYVSQQQVSEYEQYVYVPVDPNRADAETLQQLPGVDAAVAAQLMSGRPYASVEAFVTRLGQLVSTDQAASARAYLATS